METSKKNIRPIWNESQSRNSITMLNRILSTLSIILLLSQINCVTLATKAAINNPIGKHRFLYSISSLTDIAIGVNVSTTAKTTAVVVLGGFYAFVGLLYFLVAITGYRGVWSMLQQHRAIPFQSAESVNKASLNDLQTSQ
ncbi:MAG: hypothetical protein HS115_11450 [Spirochaetales bacterium]|nr:hypothetical protein [Spirochaetales bacterium]